MSNSSNLQLPEFTNELTVLAGSSMYGTRTADSDIDFRGFYMPSKAEVFGFKDAAKPKVDNENGNDTTYWEIRKFFKMAMNANPNCIEILFAPPECVLFESPVGKWVRHLAPNFLSTKVVTTFVGYATSNYHRVRSCCGYIETDFTDTVHDYDRKDAMHLIRLMRTGKEFAQTGELRVRRPEDRDYFLSIRKGEVPWSEIEAEFLSTKAFLNQPSNKAPDEPNSELLNDQLVEIMSGYFGCSI